MSRQPPPSLPKSLRELEREIREGVASGGRASDIPRREGAVRLRGKPTEAELEAQRAHDEAPLAGLGDGGYRRLPVRYE